MIHLVLFLSFVSLGSAHKRQVVQLAPEKATALTHQVIQCVSETGIEPQLILQIKRKNYTMDDTIKKFLFCAFNKADVSSKEGVVQVDKLLEIYPQNTNKVALKIAIEECNQNNEIDPMEKLSSFFVCFQNKTPVTVAFLGCVCAIPKSAVVVEMQPETAAKIFVLALECVREANITTSIFSQVRNQEYGNDDVIQQFFLCVFKKNKVADDDGEILVDNILTYYPDDVDKDAIRAAIEYCKKEGGAKPMEKVYNFVKCYQKKTPVRFTIPNIQGK